MATHVNGDGVAPSERCVPGSVNIPLAEWPASSKSESVDAKAVASETINNLNQSLEKGDYNAVADLFADNGYWRDHLALTWDLRTAKGKEKTISLLKGGHHLVKVGVDDTNPLGVPQLAPLRPNGTVKGIPFYGTVTTKHGSGRAYVRLIEDAGKWKIWTLFTTLNALKDHPEPRGPNRPAGVQHGALTGRKNWLDRRREESNFADGDPTVLIIGCGQAGLSVQARLKMLGIPALAIDKCEEVGDNWRRRYHQLVLHDSVWYDHMPYIPFPDFWPIFTPKDKLADFLRSYAQMLELNVWTRTELESSSWDDAKKEWTVVLRRTHADGRVETRTLRPKHVIQCTGHSGKKNYPDFKGMETFEGDVLCHSSDFRGAREDGAGRKAVIIGSCNSAMDISQDYYEHGYDVTVVQRSSTTVVSSKSAVQLVAMYSESGPPTEDADLLIWGMPAEVLKAANVDGTVQQEQVDRELLDGLNRAGFKTDSGPMRTGLFSKYIHRGGGYYIDVGTSQLIIDGKVKVKHGSGIREVLPRGVRLDDGTELEADEIVCATGYQNMRTSTEAIFGEAVAAKVPNVWGYDEEGETRVMWRRSGHPGLWLHGGNLALCRYFSRLVALQIKAQLEGFTQ